MGAGGQAGVTGSGAGRSRRRRTLKPRPALRRTMTDPEQRLKELGYELPPAPEPVAAYVPAVRSGDLVFVSGQLPVEDGELVATGKVGGEGGKEGDLTVAEAQAAARRACLNALAVVRAEVGSLSKVRRVVRLVAHVNSAPGFTDQHLVANGASELLADVFGEAGRHSRLALGAPELPLDAPVELDLIVEVE